VRDVAVARRIAAHGPDLVHVHDVEALPIGAFASRTSGAPLVFDAHEIYDQHAATKASREAKRRRKTHTIARFAADVDGFVTINDSIARYYRTHFPRLPEAVVVGNATSPSPPAPYDGRLHEAAGLDRGTRIALYQGKFLPRRNLPELVETAAHLSSAWALVFMGWGDLKGELEARRDALPAEARERVRFVDPVPHGELLIWTAGAAVGAVPYDNHTLNHWFCTPNKLWEFPQAGVPILVSPFPEMRRRVETYGHGWLLRDPFDPRHTAELLESLDDAELARARAACAVFNAADNWEMYESRLLDLYADLLGGKSIDSRAEQEGDA
jgi:glycosyltransferase involved in cell wall biosynthesis